jgi:hypothetical protein
LNKALDEAKEQPQKLPTPNNKTSDFPSHFSDVNKAKYFDLFQPTLNPSELKLLSKNGFVVSESTNEPSFGHHYIK